MAGSAFGLDSRLRGNDVVVQNDVVMPNAVVVGMTFLWECRCCGNAVLVGIPGSTSFHVWFVSPRLMEVCRMDRENSR